MQPLVAVREIDCASDRRRLWLALADTHRFSRALGPGAIKFSPVTDAGAARFLSRTRMAGLEIEYEERPFEWREPELLIIRRKLRNGPAREYSLALRLEARADGGCRIRAHIEVAPRHMVGWPFVRVLVARMANRIDRLLRGIDANLRADRPAYPDLPVTPASAAALASAITTLTAAVGPERAALARRLGDHVVAVPDIDAGRIRPYELAERWGVDRRDLLTVCLQAVSSGLLELSWEVVCPSCRVGASQIVSLADLDASVHCHMCDITSAIDFDRSLEVSFRPVAAVRAIEVGPFCISGPFRMPHVVEQAILPAGGEVVLQAPAQPGRYRVIARGGAVASIDVGEGGTHHACLHAGARLEPGQLRVAPGAELKLVDELDAERHVKLEHLEWASYAATAYQVSTIPAFRRLFSAEVLKPGRLLTIRRATFVFTDLIGSTGLYSQLGDAGAYSYIQDHLDLLEACAARHGGAVVKTLGDSIMAVFADDLSGVSAALAMQRDYADFAFANEIGAKIGLRVGVFAGPAYAVTANRLLDYFGQSVNAAQRLESVAGDGEVILPAELARRAVEAGCTGDARITEELRANLKGLREPLELARMRVARG